MICRLRRRWWAWLLRLRGWPDPEGALDWLDARREVIEQQRREDGQ